MSPIRPGAPVPIELAGGAAMRRRGPPDGLPVVLLNGGRAAEVPGGWGASLEWLVARVAPRLPALALYEVRYRVKSWNRLELCIEDGLAALDRAALPGRPAALVGFSMGGAVAIACAGHPAVSTVIGLAPWIPEELSLEGLRGRRVEVIHGSLDRNLPGIPGVSPASSRRGVERIRALGVEAGHGLIRGAVHPIALRAPWGRPLPAPRAGAWAGRLERELARFQAEAARWAR